MKRAAAIATWLALAATAAYAATVSLAVKPGLWQVSVRGQLTGTVSVPASVLKSMSEQERTEFEARMAATARAAANGHTFRNCVSAEQLRHGFIVDNRREGACTRTVIASSASALTVRLECKAADHATVGMVRFKAADASNVTGVSDMATTIAGKTMTVHSTTTAKWLSADCGELKPGQVQAR